MKENRKGFYQEIINEIIKQHGKDNFTYRLMGEKLEVSKQRAKQIVDYYQWTFLPMITLPPRNVPI